MTLAKKFPKKPHMSSKKTTFSPKLPESNHVSTHHDTIRFWSLVVSAILTGLLVLMLGAELTVLGDETERNVYFDRAVFARIPGLF